MKEKYRRANMNILKSGLDVMVICKCIITCRWWFNSAFTTNTLRTYFIFSKISWPVLFFISYFSTKQEFFFTGLVWSWFIKHISAPNRKFPVQYRISGIFPKFSRNFKFGNSCFIFGTETGRELASPECQYWTGTGNRMFPSTFWEISGSRELAFGNADLYPIINCLTNRLSVLNGKISLEWLNSTGDTFKVKCRKKNL